MEAYLDEEETFSIPIIRETKDKDKKSPIHKPNPPNNINTNNTKLWALAKQANDEDDERVFKFEEEDRSSPIKQPSNPYGEIRDKKKDVLKGKKLNFTSKWESPETSSSEEDQSDEDKENKNNRSNIRRENSGSCKTTLDFLEIEAKLQQMKLEKEIASYTRLV